MLGEYQNQFKPDRLSLRIASVLANHAASTLLSDASHSWTGSEIAARIQRLSDLIETSTPPGSYIGICFPNTAAKGLLILAVMATSRVPVLISFNDLSNPSQGWFDQAPLSLFLAPESSTLEPLHGIPTAVISEDGTFQSLLETGTRRTSIVSPEDVALVLFTSGSTGLPKGVLVPEDGLRQTIDHLITYFGLTPATLAPIVLPVCHSMALNTQFLPTFFAGGQSYFVEANTSFHHVYGTIREKKGTFVAMISAVLEMCWHAKNRRALGPANHVRDLQIAGGLITSRHLEMAKELFPQAVIHKGYGLTEAIRVAMISSRDKHFLSSAVGRPLPFTDIEIRPTDMAHPGAMGTGEIYVRGPNVLKGLLDGSPPPVSHDGYLATGDLGFWSDSGYLHVVGRVDDLMKINGHRVSGYEIEKKALSASELILAAKCLAIEDSERVGQKIVLCLEAPSIETSHHDVIRGLQKLLWEEFRPLKYRPREVFVLPRLPRTPNGKIAMQELLHLYSEQQEHRRLENPFSKTAYYHIANPANREERPRA